MANQTTLDQTDRRILSILSEDARISNAELARRIQLAPSATFERVRRLEERGVIRGYQTRINPGALGLDLLAFISVRTNDRPGEKSTARELARIPQVLEVHAVAGEDCVFLKVRARDPEDLARLLREEIGSVPSVIHTRSTIALFTEKEHGSLPVLEQERDEPVEKPRMRAG